MGYSFMTIEKIKTKSEMRGKFGHNYRIYNVKNADPALSWKNHEIVNIKGRDYCQCFDETLMEHGISHTRKNAVLGFEIVTTFSREDYDKIDIHKWERDNKEWLEKTFNVNKNHNNVKSMIFHGDENGNVHIHSFVVPIDEKGHLNASRFTDGKEKLRQLQDSYGQIMKEHHSLDRGLKGSVSDHSEIKRYYTALNKTLSEKLPPPKQKESLESYYERANESYVDAKLKYMSEQQKMKRKMEELRTISEQKRRELKEENIRLKSVISKSKNILHLDIEDEMELERIRHDLKIMKDYKEGLTLFPDREKAEKIQTDLKLMSNWATMHRPQPRASADKITPVPER